MTCIQIAESDLTAQARLTAAQAAKTIQTGTKGAAERFNNFVENTGEGNTAARSSNPKVEPERRDFWDSFGDAGADNKSKGSSIGTAAMRKGGGSGGGGDGKGDGWDSW